MFGLQVKRIPDRGMGAILPFRSYALFRRVPAVRRGDTVLVDHPEFGIMVRKVTAVSRTGRVALHGVASSRPRSRELGSVDPQCVIGKLILTMRWGRLLPGFSPPRSYPKAAIEATIPVSVSVPAASDTGPSAASPITDPSKADQAAS